jgi:hypothetical protein
MTYRASAIVVVDWLCAAAGAVSRADSDRVIKSLLAVDSNTASRIQG